MDIVSLYQDFSIPIASDHDRHFRPGWVNTVCPFCDGNPGFHLGYDTDGNYYTCWRCGWHSTTHTLARLLNVSYDEANEISKRYGSLRATLAPPVPVAQNQKPYRLPSHTRPLTKRHKKYLQSRNMDPDRIVKEWGIVSTSNYSRLDGTWYSQRIIAPVIWDQQAISFISRDTTGSSPHKYIVCPLDREIKPHKHVLYGKQEKWRSTGICVEGITDVWRLGVRSFATFGINYTPQQIRTIAKNFKRVPVVFDDDPQAIKQADKLVRELRFRNVDAFRVDITDDPGSLSQSEANYLVKQLI